MKRREFITLLGSAAVGAWPRTPRAQQPSMPVIGFLRSTPSAFYAHIVEAFRQGLTEAGFVEGQNVLIEQRWADNDPVRLQSFAADLIRRQVAVIVGNSRAATAAKDATQTIPIVFVTGDDPVKSGLVASLSRPTGNLTGVTFFGGGGDLNTKRLQLLHELVPKTAVIAVLLDPNFLPFISDLPDLEVAARALGRQIVIVEAGNERDFDNAFAEIARVGAGAVLISGGPFFGSHRPALVARAARHAIPAIYDIREYVEIGGLISYAASFTDAYRQAGVYAGRILKGAKPSELPVLQPMRFEMVVNLKTAKALGLEIPPTVLIRADDVIE